MFHYRLFIGNPCVGKSTLINCLEQKVLFKSGDAYKGALKDQLQKMDYNKTTYLEIHFENDTKQINEVARKINEVVKHNIKYQIFFVVEAKDQEIRENDLNAIQLVLQKTKNISYNVIINKLPMQVYEKLCEAGTLKLVFPDGKKMEPVSYLLLQFEKCLHEVEDKYLRMKQLEKFVAATHYLDGVPIDDPGNDASFINYKY